MYLIYLDFLLSNLIMSAFWVDYLIHSQLMLLSIWLNLQLLFFIEFSPYLEYFLFLYSPLIVFFCNGWICVLVVVQGLTIFILNISILPHTWIFWEIIIFPNESTLKSISFPDNDFLEQFYQSWTLDQQYQHALYPC